MKKLLAYIISLSMVLSVMPNLSNIVIQAEEDQVIKWRQTATMDDNLNLVESKAGSEDLLFEVNLTDPSVYKIEYFLNSKEKQTMEITNDPDKLIVDFMIEQGTQNTHSNETENQMDVSFLNVDYSGELPEWKAYRGQDLTDFKKEHIKAGKLHYIIEKKASSKYPGIAFNIKNKIVKLKGDFSSGKVYLYLDNYKKGTIFPIKVTPPIGKAQKINALKSLKNFTTTPTHLMKNPDNPAVNFQPKTIVVPDNTAHAEKAGSRPGIRLAFEQPKAIDETTWDFGYDSAKSILEHLSAAFDLRDLAGPDNMDFSFPLDPAGNKKITDLPPGNSADVEYHFDDVNHMYQIDIVKDKNELANPNKGIIQWNKLDKSKIYKANLNFSKTVGFEDEVDFPAFTPENEFAYTYMEFTLKRADQKEAYLEITPYDVGDNVDLEYTILYHKTYTGDLDEDNDLWLKHYQANDKKQSKINIPVPFNDKSSQDHYQILFRFSSTNIRSQLLNYQAKKDKDVPPAMPSIVSVDNLYVTPPNQDVADQTKPSQIQLDLVWQAMDQENMAKVFEKTADDPSRDNQSDNDAIYYELSVNTLPGETEFNKYQVIQVYKVTKDADGYHLVPHPNLVGDDWKGTPSQAGPHYKDGYDKTDELFRMEGIVLNKEGKWPLAHEVEYNEETRKYNVTAQTDKNKRIDDLSFPGVNYFKIRTYAEKDGDVIRSRPSMPYSFSMSMITYDVPTANNLRYEPIYNIKDKTQPEGVGIYWDWNKNKTDFKTFKDAMLSPLNKTATSIKYVGYISTNQQKLMKITSDDKQHLLNITEPQTQNNRKIEVTAQQLQKFRDGDVLYFEVEDMNLGSQEGKIAGGEFLTQITGLDPNKVYYVRFVVEVQVEDENGTPEKDKEGNNKPRTSTPSVILEMTTPKLNGEPAESEKLPLAPENFKVDFIDDEKVETYAQWEFPKTINPEQNNYGFELLNVEDQSLVDLLKETNISLEELVDGESKDEKINQIIEKYGIHRSNVQAYRVIKVNNIWQLETYDKTSKNWAKATQADFSMEDRKIKVIDKRNSPNRVLYYYVRTIKYNDTQAVLSRSRWRETAITTPELKRPINLTVDYLSTIDHNPKYERIIYFDVPLPEGVTLHDNYLVQIFVRGEKDGDFIQTDQPQANNQILYGSNFMKNSTGAPNSYQRLYYKIYGLEAGKAYDIKVRLEDRTKDKEQKPDGTYSYATSPFSDVVRTRTEFDQVSLDKENKYKEYIRYYLKRAEELKKNPYFDLTTNSKKNIFKYRGAYASGEMRGSSKSKYDLAIGEGETVIYYLPAELIKAAPEFDTDLVLWIKNQKIELPSGFVTEEDTEAIKQTIRKVKEYQSSIKDYAVMIELTSGKYNSQIQGEIGLEPLVHVSITVVKEKQNETFIDKSLETVIDNAISRNKTTLVAELDKELQYGIRDDKLNEIVNRVMEKVKKDFAIYGEHQYLSVVDSNKEYVTELNQDLKVTLKPKSNTEFQVFFRETSDWQPLSQNSNGMVRINKTGSFVATKDGLANTLIENAGNGEINEIRKNRLNKVFAPNEFTQNGTIMAQQLIRSAARILGAGDSNDNAVYLSGKGITVPYYDSYRPISKEKAYYVLAQVYAKKHNRSLSDVRITDYNAIEDYNSIDAKYRKDLLAAKHLNLLLLKNGQLLPKSSFTMDELRNFLQKLSSNSF